MASLTIRNIPEEVKSRFRQVAAAHGRSMEGHLRQLILDLVGEDALGSSSVREDRRGFGHRPPHDLSSSPDDNWVDELRRIANGAGEGVFDREPEPRPDTDL